jgi:CheY-like chemotaxis protein
MANVLRQAGHHVTVAKKAGEAFGIMTSQEFDLALVELTAPGGILGASDVDGLQLARRYRHWEKVYRGVDGVPANKVRL